MSGYSLNKIWIVTVVMVLFSHLMVAQDCSVSSQGNDIPADKLCAPKTVDWQVVYRGVNDGGSGDVFFVYDWDDGNGVEKSPATLVNPVTGEWRDTTKHIYPTDGDKCVYEPTVTLQVNGNVCTTTVQIQNVTVWYTDDRNGGFLTVVDDPHPICVGNDDYFNFVDVSQWNCEPPGVSIPDGPNDRKRWIQWIYGTNSGDLAFMNNTEVDNAVRAWPYAGNIEETSQPIYGPTAPFNTSLDIYVPDYYPVNSVFQVTLRNWNVCNPYDDPLIPGPPANIIDGDYAPVTTTALAIIVDNPDATITPVGPFCLSADPVFLMAATGGGNWVGDGIVNSSTGLFDPGLAGVGIHKIDYSVTNGAGCSGQSFVMVEVIAAPDVVITQGDVASMCPGASFDLQGIASGGMAPLVDVWEGDVAPLNDATLTNPSFSTSALGNYELIYKVTDANSCVSRDTINVAVAPLDISFVINPENICVGDVIELDPQASGGSGSFTSHTWSGISPSYLSATNIPNPTFTAADAGVFKYRYEVEDIGGCSDFDSVVVNVIDKPSSVAGNDATVCGLEYNMEAVPSLGIGEWKLINGPGVLAFQDVASFNSRVVADEYGVYLLRWFETNNYCKDSADVSIRFLKRPEPKVMEDKDTCALKMILDVVPDIGSGEWKLVGGDGNALLDDVLAFKANVSVDVAGLYSFAWIEQNGVGCEGTDTVDINFLIVPKASITPLDPSICAPFELIFNNNSIDAATYFWEFSDGYISNKVSPSHTFRNESSVQEFVDVVMYAYSVDNCVDSIVTKVAVAPSPIAKFEADKAAGCSVLDVSFTDQSIGATGYRWDFGDGSTVEIDQNVKHDFVNGGTFVVANEVELAVVNDFGCVDTISQYITVFPLQDFKFIASPQRACHPLFSQLVADPGAFSYKWDFGDGEGFSGAGVTSHLFNNTSLVDKAFNVTLYTSSVFNCLDTTEAEIIVDPSPTAQFSVNNTLGCAPFNVVFENNSIGATQSEWKFGDGDNLLIGGLASVQHVYKNDTYTPTVSKPWLIVENSYGCKDSIEKIIQVYPKVKAEISPGESGCSPLDVRFLNNSIGASTFYWNYGDGNYSTGFLGNNIFENTTDIDQTYITSMIAVSAYQCSDTTEAAVVVRRSPQAHFLVTPEEQTMPNSTFSLSNQTVGSGWFYRWTFGDGESSVEEEPLEHTYGLSGDYPIQLNVWDASCSDSVVKMIRIVSAHPFIEYGTSAVGCPPLEVAFFNNTLDATNFLWEFGDGGISSDKSPTYTYYTSGKYHVKLTAYGPGGSTSLEDVMVEVYPKPKVYFELSPSEVKIPGESVKFLNRSEGASLFHWDLGDGTTSEAFSLEYEYSEPGVYDVLLNGENEYGCGDQYLLPNAVKVDVGGEIDFPNAFTPSSSGPTGGVYTDGDSSNSVFFPYLKEGIIEYKLQIFTRWGELVFESDDVSLGWDGYYQGKLSPQGVYVWKVRVKYVTGKVVVKAGDLTLIR